MVKAFKVFCTLSVVLSCGICVGCADAAPDVGDDGGQNVENQMCGALVIFYNDGEAVTGENLSDADALACYEVMVPYADDEGEYYLSFNSTDYSIYDISYRGGDKLQELSFNLYYTYALDADLVKICGVYRTPENEYILGADSANTISLSAVSAARITQENNPEDDCDDCTVTINFKCIDVLQGINIIEFDRDNKLVSQTVYSGQAEITASENCDYVVIEEIYEDNDGQIYSQRVLYDRFQGEAEKCFYLPRDDGFVNVNSLKINF